MALKIGEVAVRGGVNLRDHRYYEREGLLPGSPRLQYGYRSFPRTHTPPWASPGRLFCFMCARSAASSVVTDR